MINGDWKIWIILGAHKNEILTEETEKVSWYK